MKQNQTQAYDRLAAYAKAKQDREVALTQAQNGLAKLCESASWETVADLRAQIEPAFLEIASTISSMAAASACDVWDAFVGEPPAHLVTLEDSDHWIQMVRAAARLIDEEGHNCVAFFSELQRQLQLIYDQAKAVCFDGQTQN